MPREMLIVAESNLLRRIVAGYALAEFNDVEVETAESAEEALRRLEQRDFDVVLAALDMSGIDGVELRRRIEASRRARGTPYVVLTTVLSEDQMQRLEAGNIRHVLTAPYTSRDFAKVVNEARDPRRKRAHARFNVPETEGMVYLDESVFPVSILNISLSGVLCETRSIGLLPDLAVPGRMDILFPESYGQAKAEGIRAAVNMLKVMDWSEDYSPTRVRIAWKFIDVPAAAQSILEDVLARVDRNQGLVDEDERIDA